MEIKDTEVRYDLLHNIKLNTHLNGEITLSADEALDVAYAIVDSYNLKYDMLEALQDAYEKDKGIYETEVDNTEPYFEKMDRDYDDYIFDKMNKE